MKITRVESFTVAIPFEAPILSAFGVSYPARIRTMIRVHTDTGLVGLGETGPSAVHTVNRDALVGRFERMIEPLIIGESPVDRGWLQRKLYQYPVEAIAVEIACWDIVAQQVGVPLYRLIGGLGMQTEVSVAAYVFFRLPSADGSGAVNASNYLEHCRSLQAAYGFNTLKMKLGANHPFDDLSLLKSIRAAFGPGVELRIDPNGSWSLPTALRMVKALADIDLQYIEEPVRVPGPADSTAPTAALTRLRAISNTPIAADHVYRMDLLTHVIRAEAADLVLADVFGCGGINATRNYITTATAFGLGIAMHSGAELCVGQLAKVHLQAAFADKMNLAGDAIYPEYVDGVLQGGKLKIQNGCMPVPQTPGLGALLDEDKLAQWELTASRHQELDQFWDHCKHEIGMTYPQVDLLVRHD